MTSPKRNHGRPTGAATARRSLALHKLFKRFVNWDNTLRRSTHGRHNVQLEGERPREPPARNGPPATKQPRERFPGAAAQIMPDSTCRVRIRRG